MFCAIARILEFNTELFQIAQAALHSLSFVLFECYA